MQLPEPNDYINQKEILSETIRGINKDFAQIGEKEPVSMDNNYTFEALVEILAPIIDDLYCRQQHKFQRLINRVDISENMLMKAIETSKESEIVQKIAALIVKRELQKAVLRKLF